MLRIHFDHRPERLADALLDSFDAAGPFDERVVVVPSAGVGRWLQRRDAQRHGVSVQLRPEFAGRWLWSTMRALLEGLPAHSPFEPERVRWHVLALLDGLPAGEDFALLSRRIGERGSVARLAAADSIAQAFDRYLAYRRDWLARWQKGQWADGGAPLGVHEGWQRWIWNRLLERLPGVRDEHPYDAFVRVLGAADSEWLARALDGQRVAVFGRVDLSPEQFALFGRLSQIIDVSFFAPDPCRELWSDLLDPVSLARVRAQRPDEAWLYDGEPALLGSWGRAHRDFVAQLLDLEERFDAQAHAPGRDEPHPFDDDAEAAPRTALQALHAAVFLRSDAPWRRLHAIDDSIRVIGAHGAVREAEILHETLLECFATMPGLEPADVVVLCADLDAAAPAIEGVFESVPAARRIPLVVSGRARGADALIVAVETIVAAAVHGIDLPRLDRLLRNPALADALALDEAEVDLLLHSFDRAGARRGLDADDGAPKHNLQAASDRLLLGAAIGSEQACGDLLAIPGMQGSRARLLEAWLLLADALDRLRALGARARPPREWCDALGGAVEMLFARSRAQAASVQRVREAIERIATTSDDAAGTVLDAAAFARAFENAIAQGAPAAVASGAVTAVPIGSLRGVPFRVVCLFGFDERAFPRRGARDEIDLMRNAPRFGDRLVRNDDRGAFLDAVLAARERLVVSCRSRDPRDDSELNSSPLVVELLSYLMARVGDEARPGPASIVRVRRGETVASPALVEHTLHPFSRRNFEGESADRASEWLATARAANASLASRATEIGPLFPLDTQSAPPSAAPTTEGIVPIERLRRALADPARTWLRESLGVVLQDDVDEPQEHEPLWPRSADDARLVQRCVERLFAGEDGARIAHELARAPATPAGLAGAVDADSALACAEALIGRVLAPSARLERSAAREPVVARVGALRLRMAAPALDTQGRLLFVSAYPLSTTALIDAWLRTALWQQAVAASATARLVTRDETVELHCADPLRALEHALAWSQRIVAQPLALFPRSWLSYVRELAKGKSAKSSGKRSGSRERQALERAQTKLTGDDAGRVVPELAHPAMRALYRDAELDFERVLPLCERVYRPVLDDTSLAPGVREQP